MFVSNQQKPTARAVSEVVREMERGNQGTALSTHSGRNNSDLMFNPVKEYQESVLMESPERAMKLARKLEMLQERIHLRKIH